MDIDSRAGITVLRRARLEDLETIAAVERELFGDSAYPYMLLRQLFDLHGAHWVVAEVEDTIRGHALVGLGTKRCAWVMSLGVTEQYRRRGLGRSLLEHAVEHCRSERADRVRLTVRPSNRGAAALFELAGFVRIAKDDSYFGSNEPREVLEHSLNGDRRRWRSDDPGDPRWIKRPRGPHP
ncbi:GNAT family N-acetyltransferase [Nocardia noduli]|uniref:GNAT family N-acetyltransferase n=1 Tax=Nocardia noduli TaxID=2815722 RepID=UPI001C22168B|nr:GNAT family N-acetyltransferase [Nocardia noduli]